MQLAPAQLLGLVFRSGAAVPHVMSLQDTGGTSQHSLSVQLLGKVPEQVPQASVQTAGSFSSLGWGAEDFEGEPREVQDTWVCMTLVRSWVQAIFECGI